MGVRNGMESLSAFAWNGCPDCSGILTKAPKTSNMVECKVIAHRVGPAYLTELAVLIEI